MTDTTIRVGFDGSEVESGMRRMGDSVRDGSEEAVEDLGGLSEAASGVAAQFTVATLAASAIQSALGLVADAISAANDAAVEFEKTNIKLDSALKQAGRFSAVVTSEINEMAAALESVTGVSDDVIRNMQAVAIAQGLAIEETTRFSAAAISLSNAMGTDLDAAAAQLTKTMGGYAGELGEVIPELKDLTQEQLANGEAIEIIRKKYSEFLEIGTEGLSGELGLVALEMSNIGESLFVAARGSQAFSSSMRLVADALKGVSSTIEGASGLELYLASLAALVPGAGALGLTGALGLADEGAAQRAADKAAVEANLAGGAFGGPAPLTEAERKREKATVARLTANEKRRRKGRGKSVDGKGFFGDQSGGSAAAPLTPSTAFDEIFTSFEAFQDTLADGRQLARDQHVLDLQIQSEIEIDIARQTAETKAQIEGELFDIVANLSSGLANSLVSNIVDVQNKRAEARELRLNGEIEAAEKIEKGLEGAAKRAVRAFLQSTGQQLIASGIQDGLKAAGMAFTGNPLAAGIAGVAAAEIAAGTAMVAGSLTIPPGIGGGDAASAGAGGNISAGGEGSGSNVRGGQDVNIFITGGMSNGEIAQLQKRGLAEAARGGHI